MDTFKRLVKSMDDIKVVAIDILKKLEPVQQTLRQPDNEILQTGLTKFPDMKKDKLAFVNAMLSVVSEWQGDASDAKREIDSFIKLDDSGFLFDFKGCPFLADVWIGDAYDKEGVDGLLELHVDLTDQFKKMTRDNLYNKAIQNLQA